MKVTISNIIKRFGENIASNIPSFTINEGEILGLVGNNGAGKTTLFRLMLDLIKSDEGEIIMTTDEGEEINVSNSEEWKKFTGAYIDSGFLIDYLTPEEYFEFVAKVQNISREQLEERLAKYESFMDGEVMGQKKLIRDLSAGNRQKVGIISAMIANPSLLILDEPFNFLDPRGQNVLKNLLEAYNKETGAAILISSHNLNHTIDISSRIALLEHGVIVKDLDNKDGSAKQELDNYFSVE